MADSGVYRTERGMVWRIVRVDDTAGRVEILRNERWVPGPIAMVGLRLSPTVTKLTPAAIRKLPPWDTAR